MKAINAVYAVSALIHVGIALALNAVHTRQMEDVTVIQMTTIDQPDKPKPDPPKPPPPEAAPHPAPHRAAPPAKAPDVAPPPAPDFGFAMSGGGGPGGIAVGAPAPEAAVHTTTRKLAPVHAPAADTCTEDVVKAKAISVPHPAYTDDARAAGIAGKVRVELTIDETGKVVEAKVLEGLGHGLDEAAVAALQGATFSPATKCGKPVSTTFVVGVTFKP